MFAIGEDFAGYRIEDVLGRGGMGMVYEATQLSLGRRVALKVIAPGVSSDSAFRERFRREGPLQARIDHPHIVPVFDSGEVDGNLYLAMRLVRGPTLRDLIRSEPLEIERVLRILTPVADALDTAHEESLIHRDVKPHNILIARRDHAFLADFGLTKAAGEESLTKTGHFVGTLDYIAPEQVRGEGASRASDLYALTAVLYECLTGEPPFPRDSDAAILYAHVADPPPCPSERCEGLDPAIDAVIGHGLAKDPNDRPASALALMDEAEAALRANGRRSSASRPAIPVPVTPEPEPEAPTEPVPLPEPIAPPPETVSEAARVADDGPSTVGDEPASPVPDETVVDDEPAPEAPVTDETLVADEPETATATVHAAVPSAPPVETPPPTRPPPRQRTASAETAEPAQPPSRGVRVKRTAAIVAAGGALAVLAGGVAVGTGLGGDDVAEGDRRLENSAMRVDVPTSWEPRSPAPAIEGLEFTEAVASGPAAESDSAMVAGVVEDGQGPSLLPAAFERRLAAEPDRGDPVKLGDGLRAHRYRNLRPEGEPGPLTLYVAPTSAGALTIACRASPTDATFLKRCESAATTLEPKDLKVFGLGADAEYGKRLERTLTKLRSARDPAAKRLREARTRTGQSRAAAAVAAAYADAAKAMRKTPENPSVREHHAAIRTRLDQLADRYGAMSSAARSGRERAYSQARTQARDGEQRLRRSLTALEELGFKA